MSDDVLDALTIGYSALGRRATGIHFPADDRVDLLVCVQGAAGQDLGLGPRIRRVDVPGTGVARSRNAAIDNAERRYLLFCDDDVIVDLEGVRAGIEELRRTGKALVLGRGADPTGALRKRYPTSVRPLTLLNSAKAATYEMLVDVEQVRAAGVRFDERFGAGVPLHLGDEYIFVADLLRAGLGADAVPFVFGVHPVVSSGSTWGTRADIHARAVALNRVFGAFAPAVRIAFAAKHARRLGLGGALRLVGDSGRPPPVADFPTWTDWYARDS